MEGNGKHIPLPDRHGMAVHLGQHLHPLAVLLDPRRPDEDGGERSALEVELGLERVQLTPEGVAADAHIEQAEVVAVQHDQAGAGAERGAPAAHELAQRLGEPLALDPEGHRGRLATWDHQSVEPV
jgi:hypothetical protein